MGTGQDLTGANWRRSSRSGDTGGQCVECAPLNGATWRKSSHSGGTGGDCVEVADMAPRVAVRDSKHTGAGVVTVSGVAFRAFVGALR
ncbi:DUF397 domain-containing protein [Streptomyces mangrovisoli]|uniref:DUF397 domain-containing protein n=1 Tax=Streptomyces mangrovisoli TaxID=1428628 RepID=UPI0009A0EC9F|nr:DUF397 domain-containing protein [Streptomyces mangrovisoli]